MKKNNWKSVAESAAVVMIWMAVFVAGVMIGL